MKKMRSLVIAGVLAASAFAGSTVGNINASATVVSTLSASGVQDMAFGTMYQGETVSIALPAVCPSTNPSDNGILAVGGAVGGESTTMTMAYDANLLSGSDVLPLQSPTAGFCGTGDDTTAPTFVSTSGTSISLAADGAGTNQVYTAASVTASVAQPSGTYTGTVTLTVTY